MDNTEEMMMENKLLCHHLNFERIFYEGFNTSPKIFCPNCILKDTKCSRRLFQHN